ncbi:MAG: hypothetical protein AAGM84_06050 [Pseudomonadota bacterium]
MVRMILLLLALSGAPALAGGIDFSKIAKGTQFFYGPKGGQPTRVWIYRGQENGKHVIAQYVLRSGAVEGAPYRLSFYDAQGRRTELHKLSSSRSLRITFAPFYCDDAPAGRCSHIREATVLSSGERRARQQRDFQIKGRGKTQRVLRITSGGQRETVKYQRDARGVITMYDEAEARPVFLLAERTP